MLIISWNFLSDEKKLNVSFWVGLVLEQSNFFADLEGKTDMKIRALEEVEELRTKRADKQVPRELRDAEFYFANQSTWQKLMTLLYLTVHMVVCMVRTYSFFYPMAVNASFGCIQQRSSIFASATSECSTVSILACIYSRSSHTGNDKWETEESRRSWYVEI